MQKNLEGLYLVKKGQCSRMIAKEKIEYLKNLCSSWLRW